MYKESLDEIPWETVLRDDEKEQRWQVFKDTFLRAEEFSISQQKKSRRGKKNSIAEQGPVLNREIGKYTGSGRIQGCTGMWPTRNTRMLSGCADRVRKDKAHMEPILAMDMKKDRKGFYRYIGRRR